jgi:hypothetical protein
MLNLLIQIGILVITGDFTGSIAWNGIEEDNEIIAFFYSVHTFLFPTN